MRELTAVRTMPLALGVDDVLREELTIRMPQWRPMMSVQIELTALRAVEAAAVRGVRWPCHPNTTAGPDPFFWWMGPERWLVSSEELRASELMAELTAATQGYLTAIVDISDALTTIQLVGEAARHLLARGTGLALEGRLLGPGRCARTRFANLAVLLRPLEETGYELLVERSEAQFLLEWLRDASIGLELRRPAAVKVEPIDGIIAVNAID